MKNQRRLKIYLAVFLGILILFILILGATPPVSKDALTHHLAVPKLFLKHGGIYEIPSMVASYYPMTLDFLYGIPLYFGNDIIPKYIHFTFALLTAWFIFTYLRKQIDTVYGLLGASLFLSTPIVVKLSINAYVDLGLTFFSFASIIYILKWIEKDFNIRYLIISSLFCGLALGTKYNGLLLLLILPCIIIYYSRYGEERLKSLKTVGYGSLFICLALLIFLPWMIKNYLWTHNPIFPLYDNIFNPQNTIDRSSFGIFAYRAFVYQESWWEMLLLPIRIFFQGQDGNPQYFDGKLNPFLLIFSIISFWDSGNKNANIRKEKLILFSFICLFFIFVVFTTGLRIRYLLPIIPPLIVLSVFGIRKMILVFKDISIESHQGIGKTFVIFLIFISFFLNLNYIAEQFRYIRPFDYLTGKLTRDEYIEKYRPEYAVMRYINENLPLDSRLLFLFMGNRGYYCDRDYIFDMTRNDSIFHQFVIQSNDAEQIKNKLLKMGISHLIIHKGLLDKWIGQNFTMRDQRLSSAFFNEYAKPLSRNQSYVLYEI